MADRVSAGAATRPGAARPRTAPGGHGESAWVDSERVTRGGGHDDRNVERRRAGFVHARAPRRNHRQGDTPREEGGRAGQDRNQGRSRVRALDGQGARHRGARRGARPEHAAGGAGPGARDIHAGMAGGSPVRRDAAGGGRHLWLRHLDPPRDEAARDHQEDAQWAKERLA